MFKVDSRFLFGVFDLRSVYFSDVKCTDIEGQITHTEVCIIKIVKIVTDKIDEWKLNRPILEAMGSHWMVLSGKGMIKCVF